MICVEIDFETANVNVFELSLHRLTLRACATVVWSLGDPRVTRDTIGIRCPRSISSLLYAIGILPGFVRRTL